MPSLLAMPYTYFWGTYIASYSYNYKLHRISLSASHILCYITCGIREIRKRILEKELLVE